LPIPLDEKPFLMPVEDVFSIRGRGAVASGRVERGIVEEGDPVEIVGLGARIPSVVSGIRGKMSQGTPGDKIGVLLRGVDKSDVQRGQVLARPGSVAPHKKFKAEVYVLKKGNGGREQPFFKGYKPQFYFRTTDVTGEIDLPDGTEIVVPGDHLEMSVELLTELALEEGLRFAIGDPKHRVGVGIVTEIVE
jgi:elongation factor Tu